MMETTRNISIIWLAVLCFAALLPPVLLLYFATRGMNWVQRQTKPILQRARQGSDLIKNRTDDYSTLAADPLIKLKQQKLRWQQTISSLLPRSSK